MSFDILVEKIRLKNNPTVVGLDPKLEYIPGHLLEMSRSRFSDPLEAAGEALRLFNRGIIDATADIIPCIKPQSAYYEMYGLPGIAALADTVDYARKCGLYVVLDCKRGDIGATSEAYASAYLGGTDVFGERVTAVNADCMTVNPYLGIDGVKPFIDACKAADKSIFCLVKTSNPSSGDFQDVLTADGFPLYRRIAERVAAWGSDNIGVEGFSRVGVVVGATYPAQLLELRALLPNTFFLIPGYGAQGAGARDIAGAFKADGTGAIINSSRAVMCAYMKKDEPLSFAECAREEVIRMRDDINSVVKSS